MATPRSAAADSALRGELLEIIASSPPAAPPEPADAVACSLVRVHARCVLFDVYGTLFASASGDVGTSEAASDDSTFAAALRRTGFALRDEAAPSRARERFFAEIRERHTAARLHGVDFPEVDITSVWMSVLRSLANEGLLSTAGYADATDPSKAAGSRSDVPLGGQFSPPVDERHAMRAAAWYEVISNPVAPMPAMVSTIEALASAGILLGIVSNAQFYTPLLFPALLGVDHTAMGFREDLCVWSYEIGMAKPSTEMFSMVLRRLSERYAISAQSVLYLGNDMLNDVWTARQAGCRAGLFTGDRRSLRMRRDDPRCVDLDPDVVISSLDALVDVVMIDHRDKESSA